MNMNDFFNPCRRYRQGLSLLAGGGLPEMEKNEIERHLTDCADCRNNFQQLKGVTKSLADYRESARSVEPTQAARQRWAKAIRAAAQSQRVEPEISNSSWNQWWNELFWSCRRAWVGIAAAWFVIWWVNWEPSQTHGAIASSTQATQTFAEQRRFLAELMPVGNSESAEEPRRKPRSETQRPWLIA
jgi:anti-sigma factor RsiW